MSIGILGTLAFGIPNIKTQPIRISGRTDAYWRLDSITDTWFLLLFFFRLF